MKRILKSKYTQASILYIILGILPSAINLLLLPLYLKYLQVADYGLLVLINVYTSLFSVFGCLQLNIAANTQYFSADLDKDSYKSGVLITAFISSFFIFGIFYSMGGIFFSFYKTDLSFYPLGLVALVSATLMAWHTIVFVFLKNEYRLKELGILSIASIILGIAFQFYLVIELKWGVSGIIFGIFFSRLVITLFLFFYYIKWVKIRLIAFENYLKYGWMALKFSIPFMPTILLHWLQTLGDRLILERFVSIDKIGQYAVLFTLLTFPQLVVNAVMSAFRPKLIQLMEDRRDALIQRLEFLFTFFIVLLLVFILFIGTHLNLLTDNLKYIEINRYLLIGVLSILPGSMLYMHHLRLMLAEKTGLISKYSLYSVTVQVSLLFVLVPDFGITGALLSYGIGGMVGYSLNAFKAYELNAYSFYKTIQPAVVFVIFVFMGLAFVSFSELDIKTISKIVSVFIILFLILILKGEIRALFDLLKPKNRCYDQ